MNNAASRNAARYEYQSLDTVLSAVTVGGLAVTGAVMMMVTSVQALVA